MIGISTTMVRVGNGSATINAEENPDYLLTEGGDYLITESGDYLITE